MKNMKGIIDIVMKKKDDIPTLNISIHQSLYIVKKKNYKFFYSIEN